MRKQTLPASRVKPGMTIMAHGAKWVVKENNFDRHGNTGNQPRQVLIADAHPDDAAKVGVYAKGMTLGMLCSHPVSVADDS